MTRPNYYLIIPAGGVGVRMNAAIPKQYLTLDNGLTVLDQSLKTLLTIQQIKGFVVSTAPNDAHFQASLFATHPKRIARAIGGKKRFHSVISALVALTPFACKNDWILVHDSVRPCIRSTEVVQLIAELEHHPVGGFLATPVIDTLKKTQSGTVITIDRAQMWQAQTPQMYRFGVLTKALKHGQKTATVMTDEASAIEGIGLTSKIVATGKRNFKITTKEDLALANFYLKSSSE